MHNRTGVVGYQSRRVVHTRTGVVVYQSRGVVHTRTGVVVYQSRGVVHNRTGEVGYQSRSCAYQNRSGRVLEYELYITEQVRWGIRLGIVRDCVNFDCMGSFFEDSSLIHATCVYDHTDR